MDKQIGIVGAGFAGLAAALELHEAGFQVTVFEARRRVGGRVWSKTLSNGEMTELGGEWISAGDQTFIRLIDRLGLQKAAVGVHFLEREVVSGAPVSIEQQWAARKMAVDALDAISDEAIAQESLGEFIRQLPLDTAQRAFMYSRIETSYAADLDKVALRMIESWAPPPPDQQLKSAYYRVTSGNMSVAQAIAGRLDDLRLDHALASVTQTGQKLMLRGHSRGDPFQADFHAVVLAVPVKILSKIAFDPPLHARTAQAIAAVRMGTAAKLTIGTRQRPELRACHDTQTPYWSWTGNGGNGKPRKVVSAFCAARGSQIKLATQTSDPGVWLGSLKRQHPDLEFDADPLLVDWSQDPWAGGCYSVFDNTATDMMPLLSQPAGRVYFAGEHTAVDSATMNGALESGVRAAKQVMQQLR
jgi:monoamine oxidase